MGEYYAIGSDGIKARGVGVDQGLREMFNDSQETWRPMSMSELRLVFTALPGPGDECVFVEAEDASGRSIKCGEWRERDDGLVELVVTALPDAS